MAMTKRAVLLLLLVGLFALASCDRGLFGDDLPSESVVVDIDLEPGANETYEFEFEVEVADLFSVACQSPPSMSCMAGALTNDGGQETVSSRSTGRGRDSGR